MQRSFGRTVAMAAAALLLAGTAQAQTIGHVVSVEVIHPAHRNVTPQCADGQPAQRWYDLARDGWESMQSRTEDTVLCAALAARAGNVAAETLLGRIYTHSRQHYGFEAPPPFPDAEAALYWFGKAADSGDGRAALEAGMLYEMGMGAPQDDARAAQWYQRAVTLGEGGGKDHLKRLASRPARIAAFEARYKAKAEAGDGAALFAMSNAYLEGDPYAPDDAAAAAWLTRSAEAGYVPAQSRLGLLFLNGEAGVKRDDAAGFDWLIKARAGGSPDGDTRLLAAYQNGKLSSAQKVAVEQLAAGGKLRNWMGQAAHFSSGKAAIDNAVPDQDQAAAVATSDTLEALMRQAKAGDADARTLLGLRYLTGDGVAKDPATARSWLEKAADQRPEAAMNLGDMAYTGEGGASDPAAAASWYAQAAVLGDGVGAENAIAIWDKAGSAAYDPMKAYAMAVQLQSQSPAEAKPLLERLRAQTPPDMRADALIWLCRLRLAHAEVFN